MKINTSVSRRHVGMFLRCFLAHILPVLCLATVAIAGKAPPAATAAAVGTAGEGTVLGAVGAGAATGVGGAGAAPGVAGAGTASSVAGAGAASGVGDAAVDSGALPEYAMDAGAMVEINWPEFIGRHDLIWEEMPRQWNEGGFVGNGQLGMMVYVNPEDNRLDFHLGRLDVTDHRGAPGRKTSLGVPGSGVMYEYPRLDIGRMALRPAGKILGMTLRQNLWDAELIGTLFTDLGQIDFRALTLRDRMVNLIELKSTEKTPAGKTADWQWQFYPGSPDSPRLHVRETSPYLKRRADGYQSNPSPLAKTVGEVSVCEQPLLAGGDYATAWLQVKGKSANASTLYISTANEVPAAGLSAQVAAQDVTAAAGMQLDQLLAEHRNWWHDFYQHSFLSIPEPQLESLYWTQVYKICSATRKDGPALDLLGPWFRTTTWPGIWWNLNIQLTYWLYAPANHMELSATFVQLVNEHFAGVWRGFDGSHQMGDFAWALHNYWLHYRYAGDWQSIGEKWLPMAEQVFAAYTKLLERGPDGKLHLSPMASPEYKGFTRFPDTNYNLALLRWLGAAIEEAEERTGVAEPERRARRQAVLADLPPPPVDANGLMIAANQPFEESHRHHSHMIGFYPLFIISPDDAEQADLIRRSMLHWHGLQDGRRLAGYSFTLAASMYAALGMGGEAVANLLHVPRNDLRTGLFHSNTFYTENVGRNPVIETPLSAANSTLELLLQSWNGKVRVFPAVSPDWEEASFHNLRAQGAFLVSAVRADSRTSWVSVESLAGEDLMVKVPDWRGPLSAVGQRSFRVEEVAPGEYSVDLKKGERVLLHPQGGAAKDLPAVAPAKRASEDFHPFGVKKGKALTGKQFWPESSPLPPMR